MASKPPPAADEAGPDGPAPLRGVDVRLRSLHRPSPLASVGGRARPPIGAVGRSASRLGTSSGEGFAAAGSKVTRTTGAVSLLGDDGKPLRSWSLIQPFPVRWTGPRLVATSSDPLEEEVEVAHHGFTAKTFSSA